MTEALHITPAPSYAPSPTLWIAFFRNRLATRPETRDIRWGELVQLLHERDYRESKDGRAFSLIRMRDGATRSTASVLGISGAVLDLDNVRDLTEVLAPISRFEYVIYSTHSHVLKGSRYRLVFPFTREITPPEWETVWQSLNRVLGGALDAQARDAARINYLPSCPSSAREAAYIKHNVGTWLDPDKFMGQHLPPQRDPAEVIAGPWQVPKNGEAAGGISLPPNSETTCPEGARNTTLTQLVGSWLSSGIREGEILSRAEKWNHERCKPPLQADEIVATVNSILRRHKRAEAPATAHSPVATERAPGRLKIEMHPSVSDGAPLFDLNEARIGQFLDREPPKRRWLLKDCLPAGKVGAIIAPGGTGKSQFVIQLGASIAGGIALAGGAWSVGEPGSVLVLASEDDSEELHRRVHNTVILLGSEHGQRIRPLVEARLFVKSMVGADNLMTKALHPNHREVYRTEYVDRLIVLAKQLPDLKLIIVDPASRFRGGEENSAEDITRFVEVLEYISKQTGAAILVVHHANKASMNGAEQTQAASRGSSAFSDGIRWQMNLAAMTKEEAKAYGIPEDQRQMYLSATVTKNNYAAPAAPVFLRRMSGGFLVKADLAEKVKRKEQTTVLQVVQKISSSREPYSSRSFTEAFGGTTNLFGVGQNRLAGYVNQAIETGYLVKGHDRRGLLSVTNLGNAALEACAQPDSAIVR